MAKIIVIVEIEDHNAEEVRVDAANIEDAGSEPADITGWDVLALLWGGDLEHLKAKVIVDEITN